MIDSTIYRNKESRINSYSYFSTSIYIPADKTISDSPMINRMNITPNNLFVALELPVNSFHIKTPHRAAIMGAPCPSAYEMAAPALPAAI